jgi:hypothetical protein
MHAIGADRWGSAPALSSDLAYEGGTMSDSIRMPSERVFSVV